MTISIRSIATGLAALVLQAGAAEVEVTGRRVNLRALPLETAEVPGQVEAGARLRVRSMAGDWVEVDPPEDIDFWVHADFVEDGVVAVDTLRVRSGAGINYRPVGTVQAGDRLTVRGTFGEWLRIAPPPNTSLWISRDYVRDVRPPAPEPPDPVVAVVRPPDPPRPLPPPPTPVPVRPTPTAPSAASAPAADAPPGLRLADEGEQGIRVQREGVVRPVGYLIGRPTRYRLVAEVGRRAETICYLHGHEEQLAAFRDRTVRVRGRAYTVAGARHPVVVIEHLALAP